MTGFKKPLNFIMSTACLSGFILVVWHQWEAYDRKDTFNTIKLVQKSTFKFPFLLFCPLDPIKEKSNYNITMTKEELDARLIKVLSLGYSTTY